MAKKQAQKKADTITQSNNANQNHKEDFLNLLKKASTPTKPQHGSK